MRRKNIIAALLSLLLIMILSGCGSGLEGSYYEVGALDHSYGKILKPVTANLRSTHFEFKKDGTVQCYDTAYESYSGTYEIKDHRITIHIEDGKGTTLSGTVNDSSSLEKYYSRDDNYNGEKVEKSSLNHEKEMDAKEEYKSVFLDDTLYILID